MVDAKDNTIVADPKGQPADGTVAVSAGDQPQKPEWLLERFKSVEDQAKSYAEAEKAMTKAGQEAARLREENARLKAQTELPTGAQSQPNSQGTVPTGQVQEMPMHVRQALETKYGMPAEQIMAMHDIMNAAIAPVKESIYGTQIESSKERFAKDNPLFNEYRGEIESILNRYPIEQRGQANVLQTAYSWVVNQHLPELQNRWIEEGKKQVSVNPTVPAFNGSGGVNAPIQVNNKSGFKMTDAQKAVAQKMGLNPDDVETTLTKRGY